jgi:hypothetical protein
MKICPKCQKEYTDDGLNFCLEDGTALTVKNDGDTLAETVIINQPAKTSPIQPFNQQPTQPINLQKPVQQAAQPKKTSKMWLWAVGVLGLGVLLCGGSLIGFFAWVATLDTNSNKANPLTNRSASNTGVPSVSPKTLTSDDRTNIQTIDLEGWAKGDSEFGTTDFNGAELIMSSKQKGFYYVLVAPENYKTEIANTRVSVENTTDSSTNLGFGLIVHSNPTPLIKDFAFLIDSVQKRYRVVQHTPQKETPVINWMTSPAIKGGAEKNILEVRDYPGKMDFYINGELITTVRNSGSNKNGVAGIYSGDAIPVAFSDFEIRR